MFSELVLGSFLKGGLISVFSMERDSII